jgi:hypothetical protein
MDNERPVPELTVPDADSVEDRMARLAADAIAFPEIFSDYKTVYLRSPLWRDTIRPRILQRDQNRCRHCGSETNIEVHHRAYTSSVMKGQDDDLLISLCANCHRRVEFDENGYRRTSPQKEWVVQSPDAVQRSKALAQEVRDAAGGRCFYCKGTTDTPWMSGGAVRVIPTERGDDLAVWMCAACSTAINFDKSRRQRSDEDKLKLLRKKPVVRYSRPRPSTGFTFTSAFRRMNAMRQEGIMNEHEWNVANIHGIERTDPKKFAEIKNRYEKTCSNGRDRRS